MGIFDSLWLKSPLLTKNQSIIRFFSRFHIKKFFKNIKEVTTVLQKSEKEVREHEVLTAIDTIRLLIEENRSIISEFKHIEETVFQEENIVATDLKMLVNKYDLTELIRQLQGLQKKYPTYEKKLSEVLDALANIWRAEQSDLKAVSGEVHQELRTEWERVQAMMKSLHEGHSTLVAQVIGAKINEEGAEGYLSMWLTRKGMGTLVKDIKLEKVELKKFGDEYTQIRRLLHELVTKVSSKKVVDDLIVKIKKEIEKMKKEEKTLLNLVRETVKQDYIVFMRVLLAMFGFVKVFLVLNQDIITWGDKKSPKLPRDFVKEDLMQMKKQKEELEEILDTVEKSINSMDAAFKY